MCGIVGDSNQSLEISISGINKPSVAVRPKCQHQKTLAAWLAMTQLNAFRRACPLVGKYEHHGEEAVIIIAPFSLKGGENICRGDNRDKGAAWLKASAGQSSGRAEASVRGPSIGRDGAERLERNVGGMPWRVAQMACSRKSASRQYPIFAGRNYMVCVRGEKSRRYVAAWAGK